MMSVVVRCRTGSHTDQMRVRGSGGQTARERAEWSRTNIQPGQTIRQIWSSDERQKVKYHIRKQVRT